MKTPYGWGACLPWVGDNALLWKQRQALELLQPERWMDYYCAEPTAWPGYVPTVRAWHLSNDPVVKAVIDRLHANPTGETWLLGNEPHFREQDDVTPARGRDLALKFLMLARSLDVDVNWTGPNCAINMDAQPTELHSGVQWWREFLRLLRRAGVPGPSYHGVHMYHSTDLSMLRATWAMLRDEWRWQWMGSAPVIVTEACAENEPLHRQIEVMDELWRLYQIGLADGPAGHNGAMGVLWFVAYANQWPNCHLVEVDTSKHETMRLTALGRHWVELRKRNST